MKKPKLAEIEALARQAGDLLREGYGQFHQVDYKGVIDPVTEIDKQSETLLLNAIHDRFPGHSIFSEESGKQGKMGGQIWYIDPLDGTVNYTHNIPIFTVSMAYEEKGERKLGVVYDPMRDECFSAERGRGAILNGEPIHVSQEMDLAKGLLVSGFPYDIWTNPENNLDNYARFSKRTQGVRRLGSAALDLCYVAAGRFEGFWEIRLNAWDVAAGALIVQEAGGLVTNIHGGENYISPPQSILAANPHIHKQMLAGLQEED